MKKLLLLWVCIFPALWGCSFDATVNMDTIVYSGKDVISETWSTTKELGKEYYEDQIKPFVDTAKEEIDNKTTQIKEEITDKTNQIKDQYNQEVEKINEKIQGQAEEAKDQVNKLKVK